MDLYSHVMPSMQEEAIALAAEARKRRANPPTEIGSELSPQAENQELRRRIEELTIALEQASQDKSGVQDIVKTAPDSGSSL